jgi:hypothetical protein
MCPCVPRCMGLSHSDAVLVFCCLEGGEWLLAWELETVQRRAENGCHARRIGLRRKASAMFICLAA